MINPYTASLLVFTALAGCFPVEAMESPEAPPVVWRDFSDFKHEWAALDEEEEEDRHTLNEVLAWQQESQSGDSDSDGEDDLEEAIRLSLEASNALQSDSENDPAVQEAILRSGLQISSVHPLFGMEQETPPSMPNTPAFKNEEKSIEDSWWLINSKVNEDPLPEETRKQQEWTEKKEELAREIVGFYPQIEKLYEDYEKTKTEASKGQEECRNYPWDSEERKSANERYKDLLSRKFDIHQAFENLKREEDYKVEACLPLLSGKEKELFEKKVGDSRGLVEELRKNIGEKNRARDAAHKAYMDVPYPDAGGDEEEKNRLRQKWFDLDDEYADLQLKLDEAIVNESRIIHEYYSSVIHGVGFYTFNSWCGISNANEEVSQEKSRKQEKQAERKEKKRLLREEILDFYPQIKALYEAYTQPIPVWLDQALIKKAQENKDEEKSKLNEFHHKQQDLFDEYRDLASEKERGSLIKVLYGSEQKREVVALSEQIKSKTDEQLAASDAYFEMRDKWDDPETQKARQKWYDLIDEKNDLELQLKVQESKAIHDYFVKRTFMKWPKRKVSEASFCLVGIS